MKAIRISIILLFIVPFSSFALTQSEVEELFKASIEMMDEDRFSEAIPLLTKIYDFNNSYTSVLWNLGIATAALGNHSEASKYWNEYIELDNSNWRVYEKLIQSYQALNMLEERESTRLKILEFYRSNRDQFSDVEEFCIERYSLNNKKVFSYESFEPNGEYMIFYTFYFLNGDGTSAEYKYSLGSYENTTKIARELGEIGPTERVYHLDWYRQDAHKTIGFFSRLPDYEELRRLVLESEEEN